MFENFCLQPACIEKGEMREYQIEGLKWMVAQVCCSVCCSVVQCVVQCVVHCVLQQGVLQGVLQSMRLVGSLKWVGRMYYTKCVLQGVLQCVLQQCVLQQCVLNRGVRMDGRAVRNSQISARLSFSLVIRIST